jgi:5-(carboxyamino)imidazole ribonucleotide synthase
VAAFGELVGWPLMLKTSRGGYDGRGVWSVDSLADAEAVLASPLAPGAQWLAEERIAFVQELSAQVARSPHGQAVAYPIVRTVQRDGICAEVVAPAPGPGERARPSRPRSWHCASPGI